MELLTKTIENIKPPDEKAMAEARARQDQLTKPAGSLGRLEEVSIKIAGIQGKAKPVIKDKAMITMAADHGVVDEKVGNWPREVTAQMVENFLRGGAGINVLARQVGARIVFVDMGIASDLQPDKQLIVKKIDYGTKNICLGPAMTVEQAVKAVESGIDILNAESEKGLDIVGTGDMGIGNTTASSAVFAALSGKMAVEVTGRGTGLSDEQLAHKIDVIKRALAVNKPNPSQPLEVLAKVGGFEIGGLTGVMLGAAARHIPVVIDGFISGAAALIAVTLAPQVKDYIIAAHVSAEAGHAAMLNYMGLKPLLSLDMRLGEGTGAALGIFLAEAAVRTLNEMATFAEAAVDEGGNAK
ncbi:MAG: nicotinate-nucleotide--dimethylbenzimidazole phosphoribosyltransferase [Chloroflexi bacterium RBG_13_52_12]|nr:MAG: nicotinate-nucleotide--dimethylbenzimidazole phosphoribosyltransferase [Chloroflexi bacterium RBG_13_52_12]